MRTKPTRPAGVSSNFVRWGAVFAGTVISLAVFALLSSLWLGLAYSDSDGSGPISENLPWFLAGTAIGSLLVAAIPAGCLSGVRGAGVGLLNGMTAWGLLVFAAAITVVPGIAAITTSVGAGLGAGQSSVGGPSASPVGR